MTIPEALLAEALHEECEDEWDRKQARDPQWQGTMHGPEAHNSRATEILAHAPLRRAIEAGLRSEAVMEALDGLLAWAIRNRQPVDPDVMAAVHAAITILPRPDEPRVERCAYWYQYDHAECGRPRDSKVHSPEQIATGVSDWGHPFTPEAR